MDVLRTPDERFTDLPDYPFPPRHVTITDPDGTELRMHYLDEGPSDGRTVLLLHGEPSWSFLYRHMIPPMVDAGLRCLVPDLIGFGKSDKPADRNDYTYARHVAWMQAFVEAVGVEDAVLFGQDWGGLIGLRIAAEIPDRFAGIVAANTFLPDGQAGPGPAFEQWLDFSQNAPELPVGTIVNMGSAGDLPPDVVAAYDAPFPDERFKEGARQFPTLVPISPEDPAVPDNLAAWEVLRSWNKPFLTAHSDGDPITAGTDRVFHERVPGAEGQPHVVTEGGGHFLQEDCGPQLAATLIDFAARLP